jgi:iron uptake system EfeUOB component EfeO/EfeM
VEIPEEPTIAPGLTTEELKTAKAETQQNLDMVEKNLTLAWGKTLNATQQDLVSKVRGFVENAREAVRSGDWERAKNLSKKAKVLSGQLAAGL